MRPLRGRGSVGCALGVPAGEECECFSGAGVAIRGPVHKEGLVGVTGQVLGRWFAADPCRRDKVVLATKLYIRLTEGPNTGDLSALHIRRACEDSLRRLGTDHIDLYQFHHIDRSPPWPGGEAPDAYTWS